MYLIYVTASCTKITKFMNYITKVMIYSGINKIFCFKKKGIYFQEGVHFLV